MPHETFKAELIYLIKAEYVERTQSQTLELSAKGIRITELLFKNFIAYIKENQKEELSYWINSFDYYNNKPSELISQIYFRIQKNTKSLRIQDKKN